MEKGSEIIYDATKEGLLALYVEAKQNCQGILSADIWEKLVNMDRRETREKLESLRLELNEQIKK